MKKTITKTIEVSYWECAQPSHRHQSESVAERCKCRFPTPKVAQTYIWSDEKQTMLMFLRDEGLDWNEIAKTLGITVASVKRRHRNEIDARRYAAERAAQRGRVAQYTEDAKNGWRPWGVP